MTIWAIYSRGTISIADEVSFGDVLTFVSGIDGLMSVNHLRHGQMCELRL